MPALDLNMSNSYDLHGTSRMRDIYMLKLRVQSIAQSKSILFVITLGDGDPKV